MITGKKNRFTKRKTVGSAAVEAAVCLPVVLVLVMGSIEISGGLLQQRTLSATAYQCALAAAKGESTCADVQSVANEILSQQGFDQYTIEIEVLTRTANTGSVAPTTYTSFTIPKSGATPAGLDELPRGTLLRITINATRPNITGVGLSQVFLSTEMSASFVFVKEI
jgi:Flp pilus assembly protein TadG